jgi:hypothetical protein
MAEKQEPPRPSTSKLPPPPPPQPDPALITYIDRAQGPRKSRKR